MLPSAECGLEVSQSICHSSGDPTSPTDVVVVYAAAAAAGFRIAHNRVEARTNLTTGQLCVQDSSAQAAWIVTYVTVQWRLLSLNEPGLGWSVKIYTQYS